MSCETKIRPDVSGTSNTKAHVSRRQRCKSSANLAAVESTLQPEVEVAKQLSSLSIAVNEDVVAAGLDKDAIDRHECAKNSECPLPDQT
jgi:hypothetical protein